MPLIDIFDPWKHERLGALPVDTEFMYKGVRYKIVMVSKHQRISKTAGSVEVRRVEQVKIKQRRKRWTLLARTPILKTEIYGPVS